MFCCMFYVLASFFLAGGINGRCRAPAGARLFWVQQCWCSGPRVSFNLQDDWLLKFTWRPHELLPEHLPHPHSRRLFLLSRTMLMFCHSLFWFWRLSSQLQSEPRCWFSTDHVSKSSWWLTIEFQLEASNAAASGQHPKALTSFEPGNVMIVLVFSCCWRLRQQLQSQPRSCFFLPNMFMSCEYWILPGGFRKSPSSCKAKATKATSGACLF